MMHKLALAAALIVFMPLSSCVSLVSGSRTIPVAPKDVDSISVARNALFAPNITADATDTHPVAILKFAFDGTLNDQSRTPLDERPTIVSYIASRVPDTLYYPGAGMQGNAVDMIDAATGASLFTVADKAKAAFSEKSRQFLRDHPGGEIRVFVTGFSRGAATARQFMNIIDAEWQKDAARNMSTPRPKLRLYSLLYETVSTGQNGNPALHLGLPRSVNYSLHFVARDEPRKLYQVDLDAPQMEVPASEGYPHRINTIYLPGAHSDIGASYPKGVGDAYRQITDHSLSLLGLIPDRCFENLSDFALFGKHDSRGWLDMITNTPAPNSDRSPSRSYRYVVPATLTPAESDDIRISNAALSAPNFNRTTVTITHRSEPFGFTARRDGNGLKLMAVPPTLVPSIAILEPTADGGADFKFSFAIAPDIRNTIHFPPKVIDRIKPSGSTVDVTYLAIENGSRLSTFVDDIPVDQQDWKAGKTTVVGNTQGCAVFN